MEVKHKLEIWVICVVFDNDETYSGGDDVGKNYDDGDDDDDDDGDDIGLTEGQRACLSLG